MVVFTFLFPVNHSLATGSTGVEGYGCIPRSATNNLEEILRKMGAPKPFNALFSSLESFSWNGTLWDLSLLVSLTFSDTLVLCRAHA